MLIGQLAHQSGLPIETIRYYEKSGLIKSEERRENNYKEYSDQSVKILLAIKRLKRHGYTLKEIREFITLFTNEETSCSAAAPLIAAKFKQLDERIAELKKIRTRLQQAHSACKDHPRGKSCRTLEHFFDFE